jgi:membrane protein
MSTTCDTHGRGATDPEQIPARGWWDIAIRVWHSLMRDNVTLVSGGLAMYALLSVFPALAAAVSGYGLLFHPADVIAQMRSFSGVLPPGVWDLFNSDLQDITRRASGTLTLTAVLGLALALLSARSGMSSLMQATNIAYQEQEKRSFVRQVLISLAFTFGAILAFVLMLLLGVAVPLVFAAFGANAWVQALVEGLRWLLLWAFAAMGLMVIYRFAPARRPARWRWVVGGALVAATLWLSGSVLFSIYVRAAGTYTRTYGALGSVIALLTWFYLSSFVLVLGAEINAEMERQTRRDTTEGQEKPLGARGAYAADTVGPTAGQIRRANGSLIPDRRKQGDAPLERGRHGRLMACADPGLNRNQRA